MNEKDAAVYKVLAEMDLYTPKDPSAELAEAYRKAYLTEEEQFLENVENLFKSRLDEMVFKTNMPFQEYTQQQINGVLEYLKDAKQITKLEDGGRFTLFVKDNFFILRDTKHKQTYGWLGISKKSFYRKQYHYLTIVYILPQFRNKGISQILFNAVKQVIGSPIIIDGPIFLKGEKFIDSLIKRGFVKAHLYNKETGEYSKDYEPGDSYDDKSVIIVEGGVSLYEYYSPGQFVKTYIPNFACVYKQHKQTTEQKCIITT